MSGSAWQQVQTALIYIVGKSFSDETVSSKVIVYNDKAETLKMDSANFESIIKGTSASGMTSFISAFEEIQKLMEDYVPRGISNSGKKVVDNVVIVFMTDGNDTMTGSNLELGKKNLR